VSGFPLPHNGARYTAQEVRLLRRGEGEAAASGCAFLAS
jgi:hypothetical protein